MAHLSKERGVLLLILFRHERDRKGILQASPFPPFDDLDEVGLCPERQKLQERRQSSGKGQEGEQFHFHHSVGQSRYASAQVPGGEQ